MARFVEMHNNGRSTLVNVDSVQCVSKQEEGPVRFFFIGDEDGTWLEVDESYGEVKRLLMEGNT